ncbi:MAG: 50S ribosomal protein L28 [Alphaproteobacteria bacterium]|nr:50S ribosomal protein L28 [Alphaproteobacteria bacterium]
MSRQCAITGKKRMIGNNVSHAKNRTKRTFLPNTRVLSFMSDILGRTFKLKVSSHGLRTINHKGGLDSYLINSKNGKLTDEAQKIKKTIFKAKPELLEMKKATAKKTGEAKPGRPVKKAEKKA